MCKLHKSINNCRNDIWRINCFLILASFIVSIACGMLFQRRHPEVKLDQTVLYGANGSNLKDFSCDSSGNLTALTNDPWIFFSMQEPTMIAAIEIDATNVEDKGGRICIFDTDTWVNRSGKLFSGRNLYWFYRQKSEWITQNIRFDLVEKEGASCNIQKIVINPFVMVFGIGVIRILLPIGVLLMSIVLFEYVAYECKKTSLKSNDEYILVAFHMMLSTVASYFLLKNLRIPVNATTVILMSVSVFVLFEFHKNRCIKHRWHKCILILFSLSLAIANNLGGHIFIGQSPYTDLMDKSYMTSFEWKDPVEIIISSVSFYKVIEVFVLWTYKKLEKAKKNKLFYNQKVNFLIPMGIIIVCWIPYLYLYYPGIILGDSVSSIQQALGNWPLVNHHPVIYTLIIRICLRIGQLYDSLTLGVAVYTMLQILIVAYALARSIQWMSEQGCPLWGTCMITGCFALMPFFGQTSIAMWKDPGFGAVIVLLTLYILRFKEAVEVEDGRAEIKYSICIGVYSLLSCFLRNNGIYAVAFLLFVVCVVVYFCDSGATYRRLLMPLALCVLIYCIVTGPVYEKYGIAPSEKVESAGVFINQMARVAASSDGNMSEEDKEFMNKILPLEKYSETYRPCVVDLLKWDKDFDNEYLSNHFKDFIKTYISIGLKNPVAYLQGWAMMTFGYWAPNRWELCGDENNIIRGNLSDLHKSGLDIQQEDFSIVPNDGVYKLFPLTGDIIELSIVHWTALFVFILALFTCDAGKIICLAPSIGIIITLLIASPYWYWPRYGMAEFYLFPVYIMLGAQNIYNYMKR